MIMFGFTFLAAAVFSAAALLYISLSAGMGPWIAPLVALFVPRQGEGREKGILLVMGASMGAAIATGMGFSLTTLYFADGVSWQWCMDRPLMFCAGLGVAVLAAGIWGVGIAQRLAPKYLSDPAVPFPVSTMTAQVLDSESASHTLQVVAGGAVCAFILCGLRDVYAGGMLSCILPVWWASGYFAGSRIIMPLLIGMMLQYGISWALPFANAFLAFSPFPFLTSHDVVCGVCVGLLLFGILKSLYLLLRQWPAKNSFLTTTVVWGDSTSSFFEKWGRGIMVGTVVGLKMPLWATVSVLVLTPFIIEHLAQGAVHMGIAAYGRYITFAILPLLCISGVTHFQTVAVCTLVGIAGAVLVDALFSYKTAQLEGISEQKALRAQITGVVIAAACCGLLFWLLCTQFELGVLPLVAHRGMSRAYMMQSMRLSGFTVGLGVVVGFILECCSVSPALVFGGLIMPYASAGSLAIGGALSLVPLCAAVSRFFWSGMMIGDVVWIFALLLSTLRLPS